MTAYNFPPAKDCANPMPCPPGGTNFTSGQRLGVTHESTAAGELATPPTKDASSSRGTPPAGHKLPHNHHITGTHVARVVRAQLPGSHRTSDTQSSRAAGTKAAQSHTDCDSHTVCALGTLLPPTMGSTNPSASSSAAPNLSERRCYA